MMKKLLFFILMSFFCFEGSLTIAQELRRIDPIDCLDCPDRLPCLNCRTDNTSDFRILNNSLVLPENPSSSIDVVFDGSITNSSRATEVELRAVLTSGGSDQVVFSQNLSPFSSDWLTFGSDFIYYIPRYNFPINRNNFSNNAISGTLSIQSKVNIGSNAGSWVEGANMAVSTTLTNPTARFTVSPSTIDEGGSVSINNTSTNTDFGAGATTYSWTFPGGSPSSSSAENPSSVTYSSSGTYTITLTVNKPGTTQSTATKTVTVRAPQPIPPIPSNFAKRLVGPSSNPGLNFTWTSLGTSVADGYRIYVVYPGSRYYSLFGTVTNGNASSYTNWSICNTAGGGGGYCPALSYSYAIRAYNSSGQLPLPSFYPSMANNGQSIEGSLDSPVYPNPAISQVNIKLNSLGVQGDLTKLEVYNSQGFLKMTSNDFTVEKGAINLDVSDLPKGEYILRINGMTSRFKVER